MTFPRLSALTSLVAFWMAVLASSAAAETGRIVEATQPVRLYLDGEQTRLDVGDIVKVGDTVLTGENGMAQIVFEDDTKIVVGPNSQMKLDTLLFRPDNTARKFAVNATRGTFRFLTGKSPSDAYSVRTPIATMGTRGTVFDFTIPTRRNTDLLVHDGEVEFCRRGRRSCANVVSGCQAIRMDHRRWNQPRTAGERSEIIQSSFPFAVAQNNLDRGFQTNIAACDTGDADRVLPQTRISDATGVLQGDDSPSTDGGGSGNPAD